MSDYKVDKLVIHHADGTLSEININQNPFLILYDTGEQIALHADLSTNFIQELLIINPIERMAEQYEKGEIGE